MKRYPAYVLAAALLLLAGCASVDTSPPAPAGEPSPARVPDPTVIAPPDASAQTRPVPGGEGVPGAELPAAAEPPPLPPASGNRAVIALLDRAQADAGAERPDAASATLERALRIEPRNARLWHELAQLRLAQGQYAQAIALAQKSNSFAGAQRPLQALNWRVIGEARIAQGNADAGQKALNRAAALEQP
ncbi:MAG: tetratricopeptide repeat protein [Hylemonella sp.]|uniref:tetratricopeptide repeat protein n=1 Tax=Hylemonella sp. TaxID=2066020 RepID=UPI0022BCE98B|nr:tetratricopeptide repeat protein [Hylemonella sp.]MCZ8251385.1 tetratricopeptide repeat protein [Hylemonella sp.]